MLMTDPLTSLAAVSLLIISITAIISIRGGYRMRFLGDTATAGDDLPTVSVVIPARNEARHIATALRSVLDQHYPALEVIVVNDRSTDATGEILATFDDPRLQVITLEQLPDGWLGKNHALETGAGQAQGEILLFTDADVILAPTAIGRAVKHLDEYHRDHLAVIPDTLMPTTWLALMAATFGFYFSLFFKPWRAADPDSRSYIGIGAFNMIRRGVFQQAGGMAPLKLRPDDDVMLGKLLKRHGARQECVFGRDLVSVEWYSSTREMIDGLMKNSFAGLDYRLWRVGWSSLALLVLFVWPYPAVLLTDGPARGLNLIIVLILIGLFWHSAHRVGQFRRWFGVGLPVTTLLMIYIVCRSTWLTLRNDGIDWRGHHYPLAELRRNRL